MTEYTPIVLDDIAATDVYTATLELRSVGDSQNIFPLVRFSHHFTQEPTTVPYAYQAMMQLAETLGAVMEETDVTPSNDTDGLEDQIRLLDRTMTEGSDGTVH